ncbi:MAG: AsmA family protein [Proteobacteria bacterium]|nr:AsmA family protein [Pseudomonadota bacterium]
MNTRLNACIKWLRISLSLMGATLVLLLALPFAVPLEHYIPELQTLASEQLHEPVIIGGVNIQLLPLPGVVLHQVRVGAKPDANIDTISARIDPYSLFEPLKVLTHVQLTGVRLSPEGLAKLPLWFKLDGPQQIDVRLVHIRHAYLVLPKLDLGPADVDVQLTPQADFESALITSDTGKLKINVRPEGKNYRLDVRARHWKAAYGPPLLFDKLSASILSSTGKMHLQTVSGTLYEGDFTGTARLYWGKDWKLSGDITTHGIQVAPLLRLFTEKVAASGSLDAQSNFSARAHTAENLFSSLRASTTFNIRHGTLNHIDLAKAAQSLSRTGVHGGDTRFDGLSGRLELEGKEYHFTDLHVNSGLLDGNGNIDISADKKITGNIDVALRGSVGLINAPLEVVGNLDDPVLRLRRSAIVGAAIGTAVLGPGLGTTLGIKASGWLERLGNVLKGDPADSPGKKTEPE